MKMTTFIYKGKRYRARSKAEVARKVGISVYGSLKEIKKV